MCVCVCAKSVVADNYGSSQTVLWGVFGGLIQSSYGSGEAAISQSGGRFRRRWPCNVCQMEGVQTDNIMGVYRYISLHGSAEHSIKLLPGMQSGIRMITYSQSIIIILPTLQDKTPHIQHSLNGLRVCVSCVASMYSRVLQCAVCRLCD